MDMYEEVVLDYISSANHRFVHPQYEIEWDKEEKIGGKRPDFVVLDFKYKRIYIVEVTRAWDIGRLLGRVKEREEGWIKPLKKTLDDIVKDWEYHITLFIREDRVDDVIKQTKDYNKDKHSVSVISLKNINPYLGNGIFDGKNELYMPLIP